MDLARRSGFAVDLTPGLPLPRRPWTPIRRWGGIRNTADGGNGMGVRALRRRRQRGERLVQSPAIRPRSQPPRGPHSRLAAPSAAGGDHRACRTSASRRWQINCLRRSGPSPLTCPGRRAIGGGDRQRDGLAVTLVDTPGLRAAQDGSSGKRSSGRRTDRRRGPGRARLDPTQLRQRGRRRSSERIPRHYA